MIQSEGGVDRCTLVEGLVDLGVGNGNGFIVIEVFYILSMPSV